MSPSNRLASLLLLIVLTPAASAAQVSKIDRSRAGTMLQQARKDIERHYYDSTFGGIDLAARFAQAGQAMDRAQTLAELFGHVAAAVGELNDSHTFFLPPAMTVRADYGWDMQMIGDSCYVTRVDEKSDAGRKGLRPGDAVLSVNGLVPTRETTWKILYVLHLLRPQASLNVVVRSPGAQPRQLDLAASVKQRKRILDLTGSDGGTDIWALIRDAEDDAERRRASFVEIDSGVLLWKLNEFVDSDRLIDDAMKRARKAGTLILDLRGNTGGSERAMLSLIGSLSAGDVTVGRRQERTRATSLIARGRGEDAFTGKLLVLVDAASASASEVLARTVQITGRGRVLGDRTAGAVMVGRSYPHTIGAETVVVYGTSVTVADVIMSDGGRLERVGVLPDEPVVPSAEDLASDRDPVLARAAGLAGVTLTPAQAGAILRPERSTR